MTTFAENLRAVRPFEDPDVEWLQLLVGDWQLISDLSFSDLVLWLDGGESGWVAVAQVRPNTGPMVFQEDILGQSASGSRAELLAAASRTRAIVEGRGSEPGGALTVHEQAVAVVHAGRVLAVLTRHTDPASARTPSPLELAYAALSAALMRMVVAGDFPSASAPTGLRRGAPRVGDGVVHIDGDGVVLFASPNAISAIHRLGHQGPLGGTLLVEVMAGLVQYSGEPVDEAMALVMTGRAPWRTDVSTRSASVSARAIPILQAGVRVGAIVLLRDVSELRRREQELLTKDATIREIHHRVKNNLQTVAALLRLQARRVPDVGARSALLEAVRRVGTIALVHETLSHGFDETVNFDDIAVRGLNAVVEVATSEHPVTSSVTGSFGLLRAEDATAMAMIISELVQNAVEHGLARRGGRVDVLARRAATDDGHEELMVTIRDDGVGLPDGFRPVLAGLGTRIVTSLVQDLHGRIRWENDVPHGTRVEIIARLRPTTR